jgi:aspartyl/asparaginyl beta-hydroxylase (cupin superfamily)
MQPDQQSQQKHNAILYTSNYGVSLAIAGNMIQQVWLVGSLEVLAVQYLGFLPRQGNFNTSLFQSWTDHRIARNILLSYNHAFCIDYSDY